MGKNDGSDSEATIAALLVGIIRDARDLISQQLALLRHEFSWDLRTSKYAVLLFVWGGGAMVVGGVVLCLMLVRLVSWALPTLPLWICYAIIGFPVTALGGGLIIAGVRKIHSFNISHDGSAQTLRENVEWITNRR